MSLLLALPLGPTKAYQIVGIHGHALTCTLAAACIKTTVQFPCAAGLHAYGLDILEVLADGSLCKYDLHQPAPAMLPADLANLEDSGPPLALLTL